jgi:hypothetical protein
MKFHHECALIRPRCEAKEDEECKLATRGERREVLVRPPAKVKEVVNFSDKFGMKYFVCTSYDHDPPR